MREMDPSKHIPMDDKIIEKDNCRSHWSQRFTLVMLMSIIYMFGLIYYMDFYNKGVENTDQEYGIVQPEDNMPITNNAKEFEKAKILIEEGLAKWENLDSVEYSVRGSDGDETAYMEYHYKLDITNDDYDFTSYNPCLGGDGPMPCMQENRYVSMDGKITQIVDGNNQTIDEYTLPFSLQEIDEMIMSYLNESWQTGYEMDVKVVEGVYGIDNQPVTFVDIDYFRQQNGNAFSNMFKVYADVILDKSTVEVVLDSTGNILEAKVPYAYDEILVIFSSYDESVEIKLP
jgi:hypothetical protein